MTVVANPGSGGAQFITDLDAGPSVHHPIHKTEWGATGTYNIVDDVPGKRFPVKVGDPLPSGLNYLGQLGVTGVIASTQSGVWTAVLGLGIPSGANYIGVAGVTGSVAQ